MSIGKKGKTISILVFAAIIISFALLGPAEAGCAGLTEIFPEEQIPEDAFDQKIYLRQFAPDWGDHDEAGRELPQSGDLYKKGSLIRRSKKITLTFDDGPNPTIARMILAVLSRMKVKATFFTEGAWVARYPSLIREISNAGHEIGNHSYSHSQLSKLNDSEIYSEIADTSRAILKATGKPCRYFRPPYGEHDQRIKDTARSEGMKVVYWDVNPEDWATQDVNEIISRVLTKAKVNGIVLLHVRRQTADALMGIIQGLWDNGYRIVDLSDILK